MGNKRLYAWLLIVLLDDANDFSWQSAKASHAVLLCQMEQGKISSWSETEKIDRVRRADQRHTTDYQCFTTYQKARNFKIKFKLRSLKACLVCITITVIVLTKSIMRLEVFMFSTFAVLALLMRANPVFIGLLIVGKIIQKVNKPGFGFW